MAAHTHTPTHTHPHARTHKRIAHLRCKWGLGCATSCCHGCEQQARSGTSHRRMPWWPRAPPARSVCTRRAACTHAWWPTQHGTRLLARVHGPLSWHAQQPPEMVAALPTHTCADCAPCLRATHACARNPACAQGMPLLIAQAASVKHESKHTHTQACHHPMAPCSCACMRYACHPTHKRALHHHHLTHHADRSWAAQQLQGMSGSSAVVTVEGGQLSNRSRLLCGR